MTTAVAAKPARANPLRDRDFRLLFGGQAISSLGDQFTLVALPWLALVLTGSALALGGVLALIAIPRAALMLFGGVFVDRLSPRRAMLLSNAVRLIVVLSLGVLVLAGEVAMPMLYGAAFVFGVADAFFFPAQSAIVPQLVANDDLAAANALTQGTTQLTGFIGPGIAGVLIAALATSGATPTAAGIGVALLIDAASFVVSIVTLTLIRGGSTGHGGDEAVLVALREGIAFVWRWTTLRSVVLLAMAINLLVVGPLNVGLPLVAYARLPEGAAAYGTLASAMGGGALLGMVAVAVLPQPRASLLGPTVRVVLALMGVGLAALAVVDSTPAAVVVVAVTGFAMGYANLQFLTWAQQRIPEALMGRVFSVILLGSVALIPVSQLVAGALATVALDGTLLAAGIAMTVLALLAAVSQPVRNMGLEARAVRRDAA